MREAHEEALELACRKLEAGRKRLAAKRSSRRLGTVTAPVLRMSEAEFIARMRQRGTYECSVCGVEVIGRPANPPDNTCSTGCQRTLERQRYLKLPRAALLDSVGCPERYQGAFDIARVNLGGEHPGRWPEDLKARRFDLEVWAQSPSSVVVLGANGAGKSMLASEMLVAALRGGVESAAWIRASHLERERREAGFGGDRPIRTRALRRWLIVLDEFGADRDPQASVELLAERYDQGRPSIVTTHRALLAEDGPDSLESSFEFIFDRMTDGFLFELDGQSQRGMDLSSGGAP